MFIDKTIVFNMLDVIALAIAVQLPRQLQTRTGPSMIQEFTLIDQLYDLLINIFMFASCDYFHSTFYLLQSN